MSEQNDDFHSKFLEVIYNSVKRFFCWLSTVQIQHRVWPKMQLVFWGIVTWNGSEWFFAQDNISNPQSIALASLWAAAAAYGKFYGETDPAYIAAKNNKNIIAQPIMQPLYPVQNIQYQDSTPAQRYSAEEMERK